jgi:hypothetical protein
MPAILIRIFAWVMTSFAGQVLYSLGLGMVSFVALDNIVGWLVSVITPYVEYLPYSVIFFAKAAEVDYGVSVIISAIIIKSSIMSAQVALAKR